MAVLVLVVVLLGVAGAKEEASLQHTQTLADGRITFSWDIVGDKLEAEVSWSGPDKVLGLGFSPKGGMQGADILLLWVGESGIPNIVVRTLTKITRLEPQLVGALCIQLLFIKRPPTRKYLIIPEPQKKVPTLLKLKNSRPSTYCLMGGKWNISSTKMKTSRKLEKDISR